METVKIYVDEVGNTKAFEDGFHGSELELLMERLKRLVASDDVDDDETKHSHQTIGIFGDRGAGKTTFILQAISRIQDEIDDYVIIGPIDPTLLEQGTQMLPHIMVSILEKECRGKKLKQILEEKPNGDLARSYIKCISQLRTLSDQWMETLGKDLMGDPETYGYELLEEMYSAQNLRSAFREFCQKALDELKKKGFLVVIDDVDMAFDQGRPVLETVRKYMDFTGIVPVILGDQNLYMLLVKQHHYNQLWKLHEVKNESDQVSEAVKNLSGQYLLKIFPGHHRISLETKSPYAFEAPKYLVVSKDGNDDKDFRDLYAQMMKEYADIDQPKAGDEVVYAFNWLPPNNTRRLVMLSRVLYESYKEFEEQQSRGPSKDFLERVCSVYEDVLNNYGLSVRHIVRISENPVDELTRLLPVMWEKGLTDFWRLSAWQPDDAAFVKLLVRMAVDIAIYNEEAIERKVGILLALLVRMGWLGQAFDEFLDLYVQIVKGDNKSSEQARELSEKEKLDLFMRYLRIGQGQNISTTDLALRLVAIDSKPKGKGLGRRRSKSHIYYTANEYRQFLKDVFAGASSLALLHAFINKGSGGDHRVISPILAIARISDYLIYPDEAHKEDVVVSSRVYIASSDKQDASADDDLIDEIKDGKDENEEKAILRSLERISFENVDIKFVGRDAYEDLSYSSFVLKNRYESWLKATNTRSASIYAVISKFFDLFRPARKTGDDVSSVMESIAKHIFEKVFEPDKDALAVTPPSADNDVSGADKNESGAYKNEPDADARKKSSRIDDKDAKKDE